MSKKVAVAGLGVLLLVVAAAVAYQLDAEVVTVALLGIVAGAAALAAMNTNQQMRRLRRQISRWQKASEQRLVVIEDEMLRRGAHVEAATRDDVLGTVKLMQEQYVGRLDRAQGDLEQAVAALRVATSARPE
ncbi:hypothetical protein [Georgenia sunbinii]|uniref:hypothetical protein n=1 Tax=Georgenia sunbinii TaxID=3117728 RepID=UPI002F2698EF